MDLATESQFRLFAFLNRLVLTITIPSILSMTELLEEFSAPHFEILAAPVEKKEIPRFSRNCASRIPFTPFGDMPGRSSAWGHGVPMTRAANEK
jgi:hypothetical protein